MLLRVEKVHFSYLGSVEVLRGVSLLADRGETVAIIGPNGSGKTTLLMVAAGLLEPSRGRILFDGKPLKEQLPTVRRRIGLVFQDPDDQLFNPTVYDELAFALRQLTTDEREIRDKVEKAAARFNLKEVLERSPHRLSIGEKRRVTLASVLIYEPELLLLDEPTANLSTGFIEEVREVVEQARKAGKAVVVASHNVEFVAEVADRVYVMNSGRLLGGGKAEEVLSDEGMLTLADMKPPLVLQTIKLLGLKLEGKPPLTLRELRKTLD